MKIVALAGGVGGAKLSEGLAQNLPPGDLTIIVNTGDDFEHLGLYISPDLDTVCYTLAGLANSETGWGLKDETYYVLEKIQNLGGPVWFRLGDRDLATHIERTKRLKASQTLSQVTRSFCNTWGILPAIFPMSDFPVRTMVNTVEEGELPFQEYFVHRKCQPKVRGFRFAGIEISYPAPGVIEAIDHADAVVLCPSNPWVSIDPILSVPGIRESLETKAVVAVSPIIAGRAVKGPAAKMYSELGIPPSALAVNTHYGSLLSGFILDNLDTGFIVELSIPVLSTNTLMNNREGRCQLAKDVLNFIQTL
jgi:LPPG:FO 2-phospho-L-lactate transferase